jgi:hypothetical protein
MNMLEPEVSLKVKGKEFTEEAKLLALIVSCLFKGELKIPKEVLDTKHIIEGLIIDNTNEDWTIKVSIDDNFTFDQIKYDFK